MSIRFSDLRTQSPHLSSSPLSAALTTLPGRLCFICGAFRTLSHLLFLPTLNNSLPHHWQCRLLTVPQQGNLKMAACVTLVLPGFQRAENADFLGNPSLRNHPYLAKRKNPNHNSLLRGIRESQRKSREKGQRVALNAHCVQLLESEPTLFQSSLTKIRGLGDVYHRDFIPQNRSTLTPLSGWPQNNGTTCKYSFAPSGSRVKIRFQLFT